MNDLHDLGILLKSQIPLLLVESREEKRVLQLLTQLAITTAQPLFAWSITEGLHRADIDMGRMTGTVEPAEVLRHIRSTPKAGIYVLLDFHPYLAEPLHVRLLKEIALQYEDVARHILLVSHAIETPPEISHLSAHFAMRLPDNNMINSMIREEAANWKRQNPGKGIRADREALNLLTTHLTGLTARQARRIIRMAIADDGAITESDMPAVMQAKNTLMNRQNLISFEYQTAQFSEVAGLDNLKNWINKRKSAFKGSSKNDDFPKGILLLGIQGGGKSLAAKAVAAFFGAALLRLDFASLYNKYIGESEKNLRNALQTAEMMSPCVLWIDEIEKGLSQGNNDDGVSRRILGTLLTWMAENAGRVFIVATSNDIQQLPPELMRKGRIDEIFFVDLPELTVREQIFRIHLQKRNFDPEHFDLRQLAIASEGFSGAEIEQAIVAGTYTANAELATMSTETLINEVAKTRPLSVVMAEQIAQLRHWAKDRTVRA